MSKEVLQPVPGLLPRISKTLIRQVLEGTQQMKTKNIYITRKSKQLESEHIEEKEKLTGQVSYKGNANCPPRASGKHHYMCITCMENCEKCTEIHQSV